VGRPQCAHSGQSALPGFSRKESFVRSWSFALLFLLVAAFLLPPPARAIKRRKDETFDFGSPNCFGGMIQGAVYDLPAGTQMLGPMLPMLQRTKPGGVVCTFTLNVPTRSWLEGIPV